LISAPAVRSVYPESLSPKLRPNSSSTTSAGLYPNNHPQKSIATKIALWGQPKPFSKLATTENQPLTTPDG
jgi:hypothetical protein